jgi:hypothetical protein
MMFVFYLRNFSNEKLILRIKSDNTENKVSLTYPMNLSILKINRGTLSKMNDSVKAIRNEREVQIEIPAKSTICIGIQVNNPRYLFNRFIDVQQTYAYIEKNNQIVDTLTYTDYEKYYKKWNKTGGIMFKNVYFYDYH